MGKMAGFQRGLHGRMVPPRFLECSGGERVTLSTSASPRAAPLLSVFIVEICCILFDRELPLPKKKSLKVPGLIVVDLWLAE